MQQEHSRLQYGSHTYRVLRLIEKKGVVTSGEAHSLSLHRLHKMQLIRRYVVNLSGCPNYYFITQKGKDMLERVDIAERERVHNETFFAF